MDPLSDVLSMLKPRSYMYGGFDIGGNFSIQFSSHQGIKCYAVVSGECWLSVEGMKDAVRMQAGDCFLLPRGLPFCLTNDTEMTPVNFYDVLPAGRTNGSIVAVNGGQGFFMLGGNFVLDGHHAEILLAALPRIVHVQKESDKAALQWAIQRMMHELREPQPGSFLIMQYLASMMLVQALRAHLTERLTDGVGWLFALGDKQMGAAIAAMHDDPSHHWTLHELSARVSMSRSVFAQKFKDTVGTSPMDYLTRWRMLLAANRLTDSDDAVSTIALSLGYQSESAFSSAFKKTMGRSPRQYGRTRVRGVVVG